MDEYDFISDSYSMELMIGLLAERIWGRVQSYLRDRDAKADAKGYEDAKQMNEDSQNKKLDEISKTLAAVKAKQDFFEEYLKNKMK